MTGDLRVSRITSQSYSSQHLEMPTVFSTSQNLANKRESGVMLCQKVLSEEAKTWPPKESSIEVSGQNELSAAWFCRCGNTFEDWESLKEHIRLMQSEKYQCSSCLGTYRTSKIAQVHISRSKEGHDARTVVRVSLFKKFSTHCYRP